MKPVSLKNFAKIAYKAGDVIYSVNDASHSVYLVHSGSVQIESKQGMVLGVLNEGELFGEVGLITAEPRTVTVRAKTNAMLIKLDEPVFREKMAQADPICNAIIRGLALRISDANTLAEKYWRELNIYKSIDESQPMLGKLSAQIPTYNLPAVSDNGADITVVDDQPAFALVIFCGKFLLSIGKTDAYCHNIYIFAA